MNKDQQSSHGAHQTANSAYFKQGLLYLISGAQESLLKMHECLENPLNAHQRVSTLAKELQTKVEFFKSNHLNRDKEAQDGEPGANDAKGNHNEEASDTSPARQTQKLSLAKRAIRKLKNTNQRLKKRIKGLRARLKKARKILTNQKEEIGEKEENLEPIEELEEDLVQESEEESESCVDHGIEPDLQQTKEPETQKSPLEVDETTKRPKKLMRSKTIQVRPQNPKNQPKATLTDSTLKNLSEKVEGLHGAYLRASQTIINRLTLKVEKVHSHPKEGIIGKGRSIMGIKNHNSYLLATKNKGLQVIENGDLVYSDEFQIEDGAPTRDIIYVKSMNCYFLDSDYVLFRKDINSDPPYEYMDILCRPKRIGAGFQYSSMYERLILNKDRYQLSAVNLETKRVEVEMEKTGGGHIKDFRLLQETQDKVVSVTRDGVLVLYKFNFLKKKGSVIGKFDLDLIKERDEIALSIAVCPKGRFILVEVGCEKILNFCSRTILVSLNDTKMAKKAVIDQYDRKLPDKLALGCLGYVGNHVIWVGLPCKKERNFQVLDYDIDVGEFREVRDKKMTSLGDGRCFKFSPLGQYYYFVDYKGVVWRFCLKA